MQKYTKVVCCVYTHGFWYFQSQALGGGGREGGGEKVKLPSENRGK